jgi:hypothetical protein
VIDEKRALIMLGFLVNPKFLLRYVWIPVMLAEIGELLINVSTNICVIDYPNLNITSCFVLL